MCIRDRAQHVRGIDQRRCVPQIARAVEDDPVSYTHLDVYKRQPQPGAKPRTSTAPSWTSTAGASAQITEAAIPANTAVSANPHCLSPDTVNSIVKALNHITQLNGTQIVNDDLFK